MKIQNKLVTKILIITGYRFPKEGLFGRGTFSRSVLRKVGINIVVCNFGADIAIAGI